MTKFIFSLIALIVCVLALCSGARIDHVKRESGTSLDSRIFDMEAIGKFMECMRERSGSETRDQEGGQFPGWMQNFSKCMGQVASQDSTE